jgi:hypothetical protein
MKNSESGSWVRGKINKGPSQRTTGWAYFYAGDEFPRRDMAADRCAAIDHLRLQELLKTPATIAGMTRRRTRQEIFNVTKKVFKDIQGEIESRVRAALTDPKARFARVVYDDVSGRSDEDAEAAYSDVRQRLLKALSLEMALSLLPEKLFYEITQGLPEGESEEELMRKAEQERQEEIKQLQADLRAAVLLKATPEGD